MSDQPGKGLKYLDMTLCSSTDAAAPLLEYAGFVADHPHWKTLLGDARHGLFNCILAGLIEAYEAQSPAECAEGLRQLRTRIERMK